MKQITLIGDQSFTWNAADENTILRSFEGFEYPTTRTVIEDVPARDGAHYVFSRFGRRRISWTGDLVKDSIFEQRRQMLEAMPQKGLKKLLFTTYDDLQLQAEIEVVQVLNPYTHGIHTFQIEAVAPDPRFFSQSLTESGTEITEFSGGTPIPSAIPSPIGGATSTPLVVQNVGNENTSPTFRIRGPGTEFTVTNITTGQSFTITGTYGGHQTIIIDTLKRTVMVGNANILFRFSGDWIDIVPGQNAFRFTAIAGTDDNTRLFVDFRSAYRGV